MLQLGNMLRVLAAVTAIASATPLSNIARSTPQPVKFVDTFDNVTSINPTVGNAGYQNDINYSQFNVAATGPGNGVVPASQPNVGAVTTQTNVRAGGTSPNPFATAVKSGAIQYFSLVSFFAGCVQFVGQSTVSTAVGCNFVVTGFDIYGNPVPEASFSFAPSVLVQNALTLVALPIQFSLGKLQNYSIGVSTAAVDATATIFTLDNVTHYNTYWK